MAIAASKLYVSQVVTESVRSTESCGVVCSFSKSVDHFRMSSGIQRVELRKLNDRLLLNAKLKYLSGGFGCLHKKSYLCNGSRLDFISCMSNVTRNGETTDCGLQSENFIDRPRNQIGDGNHGIGSQLNENQALSGRSSTNSKPGIAEACKFAYNDAKFVNERARNDIVLLSRGITRLNDRARQDVAVLGMEFLKLDARAREDTEKFDNGLKKKAARLHHIATLLKARAQTKLKRVADQHWSDGALEADLRRADVIVRRRAMEDAFMALQFVRNIHDMMVNKQLLKEDGALSVNDVMGYISLERNGKPLDLFPGEISTDRIAALEEVYWSMASALSEADGIDYNDPEELELLVATLIDLDAMDGKSSALLLAECSSSPDVNTRKALANALAAAPSMWTLGNAGMGALQRLAEDSNPAVAAAASNAIFELRRQWEIQEGDSLTFVMNQHLHNEDPNGTS